MRIALVVQGGFDSSGRERVVPALLWLAGRLARRHELHVFALRHEARPRRYPLLGAEVHDLGGGAVARGLGLLSNWRPLLAGLRAAGPFDVVHGYMGWPAALAALAARRLGLPAVVSFDGGELVRLPEIAYGLQGGLRGRLLLALASRLAARVTVSSRYMARLAEARGLAVEVLPLGADARLFGPAETAPAPRAGGRLLHVASLTRVKDPTTLLAAFGLVARRDPGARLDMVGEDFLGGRIQARAAELGLGARAGFHGWLPVDRLAPFYRRSDLLVVSSRHEAGGVAVLEAALCGVPAVGTAVGHVADGDGERSRAVPVGDPEALAAAALDLLESPGRRRELGAAARAWALQHDADWTAARFEQLYASLSRR